MAPLGAKVHPDASRASKSRPRLALAGVIVLMLWFYLTGLSLLIGSQINATIEHAAAEHGHVEAKGPGEKKAA